MLRRQNKTKDHVLRHCRDARCQARSKNNNVCKESQRRVFRVAADNKCAVDGNKSGNGVMSCYRYARALQNRSVPKQMMVTLSLSKGAGWVKELHRRYNASTLRPEPGSLSEVACIANTKSSTMQRSSSLTLGYISRSIESFLITVMGTRPRGQPIFIDILDRCAPQWVIRLTMI